MQGIHSAGGAGPRLAVAYTDKPVSGWGGLLPLVQYLDRLGVRAALAHALPDGRRSPNQVPVVDLALAFLATVLTGGQRFAHVERLRADPVGRALLGVRRMPSAMTVTRYFNGFGRSQVAVPGYTFHVVVTTLALPPADVWRCYNGRADCENRLNELEDDFRAGGFCLQTFDGTEAAFRLICFLFNLVASFKREVTQDERPRLGTLRPQVFVPGAVLGATGRTPVLRLGLRGRWRERFATLLARVAALPATVAQAANRVIAEANSPPRPWRPLGADRVLPVQLRLRPKLN